ncbi:molybdate transport repressor ModE-like protein [Paucibacter oligotrophus]|uniref:Molybdate transport repressor ModE-like protein n=1 Tax=Roseateles oligotrophus TaxID=1769250 RepID=A0A840L4H0_9BURK|nr:substrate-binding domain-containing protein [Roseateles oligotrophus]MBB4842691.1 molybdate transport repressor ModE-like protein [Roseateles oligotrophus]
MKKISIKPSWTIQLPGQPPLPPRLLELLAQVRLHGSLQAAALRLGLSYRHAWDLIRQGEAQFKAALLHMERGKGSTLTLLGEKLVWADQRISASLGPVLDSLASELAAEIRQAISGEAVLLRIHASHGYAIESLVEQLQHEDLRIEHRYCDSTAAAAALRDGSCDAAGLHIPLGDLQDAALRHYSPWLTGGDFSLIDIASRRQGLMLAPGNPKKIYELADLLRPGLRFINRQVGSGTRLLLESLLQLQSLAAEQIAGFEQGEFTHAAVAAYVASGMADAGFGLEPAARQFQLDFIPLAKERYFLLCPTALLETPALQRVLAALREPGLRQILDRLPGYDASEAGRVTLLHEAYPQLAA